MKKISTINFIKTTTVALIFAGQLSISFANPPSNTANPSTTQTTPTLEKSLSAGINAAVDSALGVNPNTGTAAGNSNKCPPGQAKKGNCFCPPGQHKKGAC
jgi:hypothetical protein